ncbi:MAG: PQQ-binding-like beta-propeller repeat protein [Caldisericales bacterium]|nr:PQQ-binding-like beta-propeller repeat protein [Caldisericales bacterium]
MAKKLLTIITVLALVLTMHWFEVKAAVAPWMMYGFSAEHKFASPESLNFPLGLLWEHNSGGGFACKAGPCSHNDTFIIPLASGVVECMDSFQGKMLWSKKLSSLPIVSRPSASGDYVLVSTQEGILYSLLHKSGEIVAKFDAGDHLTASPLIVGGLVYIATTGGIVIRLTLNGLYFWGASDVGGQVKLDPVAIQSQGKKMIAVATKEGPIICLSPFPSVAWTISPPDPVEGSISPVNNGLLYVTSKGVFYNAQATDGSTVWSLPQGEKCPSGIVTDGDNAYVATFKGTIRAVSIKNGYAVWSSSANGQVMGRMAVFAGKLYASTWSKRVVCLTQAAGEPVWQIRAEQNFSGGLAVSRNGLLALPDIGKGLCLNPSRGSTLWTMPVGGLSRSAPVSDGERVYYALTDGTIRAIHISSGNQLWSADLKGEIWSSPCVSGKRVLVAAADQPLSCIDSYSGMLLWKSQIDDYLDSAPVADGSNVYLGAWDGKVYCVEMKTGRRVWSQLTSDIIQASPSVSSGGVVVGSWDDKIYMLDHHTGGIRWVHTVGDNVSKTVSIEGQKLYFPQHDTVTCLDARNSATVFQRKLDSSIASELAIGKEGVFALSDSGQLYCMDKESGSTIWSAFVSDSHGAKTFCLLENAICIVIGPTIKILSRTDGKLIWEYDSAVELSQPIVTSGRLIFTTSTGSLLCFGPSSSNEAIATLPEEDPYEDNSGMVLPISRQEAVQRATSAKTTPDEIPIW